MADIADLLSAAVSLATGALGFSPTAFERAATSTQAQCAALLVAFLAGVSEMLGQSVILVVNRVALYRFLASLAYTGASYALTVVTWGLATVSVAPLTPIGEISFSDFGAVTGILALAFAPRLFGVFSIAPYLGVAFAHLLEAWAMALAIAGLYWGLDMPVGPAIFCGGLGFAVSYAFRTFLGRLLAKPLLGLHRLVAGSSLDKTPGQIIEDVLARLDHEARR